MSDKPGMLTPHFFLSYARPDPLTGNPRESAFSPGAPLATFSIEVAALTAAKWCPFPGQEFPLADCARQIIERFDFSAHVSEVTGKQGTREGNARELSSSIRPSPLPREGQAALTSLAGVCPVGASAALVRVSRRIRRRASSPARSGLAPGG